MKIYIVQEISYIYNDEYYTRAEHDQSSTDKAGQPREAYRDKTKAQSACYEKNQEKRKQWAEYEDSNGRRLTEFFEVISLEVEGDEVEASPETYEEMKKQADAFNKKKSKIFKAALLEESAKIFEKYPDLNSYAVKGYAPGFNDGDPCYYSLHNYPEEIDINGYPYEDETEDDEQDPKWREKAAKDICKMIDKFDEADFESTFGEGHKTTVKRDGTIKNDDYYDHG